MWFRILAVLVASTQVAAAQKGPLQGVYACNVFSYGRDILARQIKMWSNARYEHVPIGAGGKSDWGMPGTGRWVAAPDGAPTFQDGPLEGSKIENYTFDGKSARFGLQGPGDNRPTRCFGPAYNVDLK